MPGAFLTVRMEKMWERLMCHSSGQYLAPGGVCGRGACQMLGLVGADCELRVAAAVHAPLVDVGRALDHVLHTGIMPLTQQGRYDQD